DPGVVILCVLAANVHAVDRRDSAPFLDTRFRRRPGLVAADHEYAARVSGTTGRGEPEAVRRPVGIDSTRRGSFVEILRRDSLHLHGFDLSVRVDAKIDLIARMQL